MSMSIEYCVSCDQYHRDYTPTVMGETEIEVREIARASGWVIINERDICEECYRGILRSERAIKEATARAHNEELEAIRLKERNQQAHLEAIRNEYTSQLHYSD